MDQSQLSHGQDGLSLAYLLHVILLKEILLLLTQMVASVILLYCVRWKVVEGKGKEKETKSLLNYITFYIVSFFFCFFFSLVRLYSVLAMCSVMFLMYAFIESS